MRTLKRHSLRKNQSDNVLSQSLAHPSKLRKTERGGFKKPAKATKAAENRRPVHDEKAANESDDYEEEQMDGDSEAEEVEVAYKEPTVYEDLLKKLGTRNENVAEALRRRQREEQGKGGTDDDTDSNMESISESEEDDDNDDDGNDNTSPRIYAVGNGVKHGVEQNEDFERSDVDEDDDDDNDDDDDADDDDDDDEDDDGDAMSDTDEESGSRVEDQPLSQASMIIRFL